MWLVDVIHRKTGESVPGYPLSFSEPIYAIQLAFELSDSICRTTVKYIGNKERWEMMRNGN